MIYFAIVRLQKGVGVLWPPAISKWGENVVLTVYRVIKFSAREKLKQGANTCAIEIIPQRIRNATKPAV